MKIIRLGKNRLVLRGCTYSEYAITAYTGFPSGPTCNTGGSEQSSTKYYV